MSGPAIPQLCFTLMAPYGAWGAASLSSATTAWKATELDPPKSALVGLLGAALGLERARLAPLAAAVRIAVRTVIRPVRDPRPDYHTIGRAHRPEGRAHWSRFEEMRPSLAGRDHAGALLSKREYWSCGLWTVAVAPPVAVPDAVPGAEGEPGAAIPLERLAAALARPRWPLSAGRKACTLGLPPDPAITAAAGPVAALTAYGLPWDRHPALAQGTAPLAVLRGLYDREGETIAWDTDYPGDSPPGPGREVRRRDRPDPLALPGGRIYQRFQERTELRARFPHPPAAGEAA